MNTNIVLNRALHQALPSNLYSLSSKITNPLIQSKNRTARLLHQHAYDCWKSNIVTVIVDLWLEVLHWHAHKQSTIDQCRSPHTAQIRSTLTSSQSACANLRHTCALLASLMLIRYIKNNFNNHLLPWKMNKYNLLAFLYIKQKSIVYASVQGFPPLLIRPRETQKYEFVTNWC